MPAVIQNVDVEGEQTRQRHQQLCRLVQAGTRTDVPREVDAMKIRKHSILSQLWRAVEGCWTGQEELVPATDTPGVLR